MTNDEQKILAAFREWEQEGSDFFMVIQHEKLDTGGSITLVKKACPTRIYEVSRPLYDFATKVRNLIPQQATLFLLSISDSAVQIFDIKNDS